MSPVSSVFHTVVTVSFGLKPNQEWEHPFHVIEASVCLYVCIGEEHKPYTIVGTPVWPRVLAPLLLDNRLFMWRTSAKIGAYSHCLSHKGKKLNLVFPRIKDLSFVIVEIIANNFFSEVLSMHRLLYLGTTNSVPTIPEYVFCSNGEEVSFSNFCGYREMALIVWNGNQ